MAGFIDLCTIMKAAVNEGKRPRRFLKFKMEQSAHTFGEQLVCANELWLALHVSLNGLVSLYL